MVVDQQEDPRIGRSLYNYANFKTPDMFPKKPSGLFVISLFHRAVKRIITFLL